MIDIFSILLTHGLILLVGWRMLFRDDLDYDDPEDGKSPRGWERQPRDGAPMGEKAEGAGDA
ncbi:hypothetical protein [Aurantiacibacter sediminis]|uniref:Uncharacterized protein n=1 Tax=Aurantiacibacter sediminis TaxID=2793064 RepID=A0ABS0N1U5_9SPHN|nr:hypothetical protein [Aurantiacibacter sediminis]MBH5321221.1 hypothetical protein [Aurantiacibacter sediminis]